MEPDESFAGAARFRRDGKCQRFEFDGNPDGGGTSEHDNTLAAAFEIQPRRAHGIYVHELPREGADEHGIERRADSGNCELPDVPCAGTESCGDPVFRMPHLS